MRACVALLLLAAVAAAYEGKYGDDPRLARIREELPARRVAAVRRLEKELGVEMPAVRYVILSHRSYGQYNRTFLRSIYYELQELVFVD